MLYSVVKLTRDETNSVQRAMAPWEVPVLGAVHGEEKVEVIGSQLNDLEYPDPASEVQRLSTRYRHDVASGIDFVNMVYGSHENAIDRIASAIAKAKKAEKAERKGVKSVPAPILEPETENSESAEADAQTETAQALDE